MISYISLYYDCYLVWKNQNNNKKMIPKQIKNDPKTIPKRCNIDHKTIPH